MLGLWKGAWFLLCLGPALACEVVHILKDGTEVCEDLSLLNGTISLSNGVTLSKRVYTEHVPAASLYNGRNKSDVLAAEEDVLGLDFLLNHTSISFDAVLAALPPATSGWGAKTDYAGQHTFTGSRFASLDVVFDHLGDVGDWAGYPRPANVIRDLSNGTDTVNATAVHEGLLGGILPILIFVFPLEGASGVSPDRWEMTVVPDPNEEGFNVSSELPNNHEQVAYFRFLRVIGGKVDQVQFFDTYSYLPGGGDGSDESDAAELFYSALRTVNSYWKHTLFGDGAMEMELPGDAGAVLRDQAFHSIIRDMLTREQRVWPRYGVCGDAGGCAYGNPHSNGFQEIFTSSLAAAIEYGMGDWAREVTKNYLSHYLRAQGNVHYRGLEMAQTARSVTLLAHYYHAFGDSATLLNHFDKINAQVLMLLKRRAAAKIEFPKSDVRHGMIRGHDEADLFVTWANGDKGTEMAFFSIGYELLAALRALGGAWEEIGAASGREDVSRVGTTFLAEVQGLRDDIERSMKLSEVATGDARAPVCHPYVAGGATCQELSDEASVRDSEPWRTYSEMAWSSELNASTFGELLRDLQFHGKNMRLGLLSGTGSSASGNDLMSFTQTGWGKGLLQFGYIPEFTLALFSMSTHAMSRGTWTAYEEVSLEGDGMPYCSPSQLVLPIWLKWALVSGDPQRETLWILRGAPVEWWKDMRNGRGSVRVRGAPISNHVRLGFPARLDLHLEHDTNSLLLTLSVQVGYDDHFTRTPPPFLPKVKLALPENLLLGEDCETRVGRDKHNVKMISLNENEVTKAFSSPVADGVQIRCSVQAY